MPVVDSTALTLALVHLHALHQSACALATEANTAKAEAGVANERVRALVEDIIDAEAREIAAEMISAIELHWHLLDKLMGHALLDDARPGGPRLREFQKELLVRVDRRKAAIAENALYRENHNYIGYLDSLADASRRSWLDYGWRLSLDANARLDAVEQSQ